MHIVLHIIG